MPLAKVLDSRKSSQFLLIRLNCNQIYNLPTTFTKRSCSFGFGKKSSFENQNNFPGPNYYKPKINLSKQKISISFGIGQRLHKYLQNPKYPGPGAYNQASTMSKLSFSIYNKIYIKQKERSPGPKYNISGIGNQTFYSSSKFKKNLFGRINPSPKQTRKKNNQSQLGPTPTSCIKFQLDRIKSTINGQGKNILSKFNNSNPPHFGVYSNRTQIHIHSNKSPGPGDYDMFSQFAQVELDQKGKRVISNLLNKKNNKYNRKNSVKIMNNK